MIDYVLLALCAGVLWVAVVLAGLVVSGVAALVRRMRRGPATDGASEGAFLRRKAPRRWAKRVFLWLPLGLVLLLGLVLTAEARYRTWQLRSTMGHASSLQIRTGGHCHRDPQDERVLLTSSDPAVIAEVRNMVSLGLSSGSRCLCCGEMTFEYYDQTGLIGSFSFHHGERIRLVGDWLGDRRLSSGSQRDLQAWLDDHGVTRKLRVFEEERIEKLEARWAEEP